MIQVIQTIEQSQLFDAWQKYRYNLFTQRQSSNQPNVPFTLSFGLIDNLERSVDFLRAPAWEYGDAVQVECTAKNGLDLMEFLVSSKKMPTP